MTKRMPSGQRDAWLTIEQLPAATDAVGTSGFPVETWTTLYSTWASRADVDDSRYQERFVEGQLSAPAQTKWQVDYRPDMDPDLLEVPKRRRVVYEGRTYDIMHAAVVGRRAAVDLVTLSKQG